MTVSTIICSPELKADLIRDEGVRTKPYIDTTGNMTIGVGHNLRAKGLCLEAIMVQLDHDMAEVASELRLALPWVVEHPEPVQRVLLNIAFNIGVDGLLKWPHTLALIEAGQYRGAARAIRDNHVYVSQVHGRATRLADILDHMV